ncbi:MAG: class I SAM-dependent methyltransferase [Betaproteobacteria bacterium]
MKQALQTIFRVLSLLILAAGAMVAPTHAQDIEALIGQALTGSHRSDANKARDQYRHPKETLLFFGLKPNMTVVEITPGAGWYTEILAPVMRGGTYYAAVFKVTEQSSENQRSNDRNFRAKLASDAELYGKVQLSVLAPNAIQVAPAGSADMVLTFRNAHNWARAGTADAMFKAFYDALQMGGILGLTDHRAKPDTPFEKQIESGYMTEAWVIETAQKAGFRLESKSEINANPKDTADYPGGVWTLPPTLRLGDKDRVKYLAIGESDRMTLRFVKP